MEQTFCLSRERYAALQKQTFFSNYTAVPNATGEYMDVTVRLDSQTEIMELVYGCIQVGITIGHEFSKDAISAVMAPGRRSFLNLY